jgi:hypothetical protein
VPRPQPSSSPPQFSTSSSAVDRDTIVAAALSDGVSVSNGSVLPQARHASSTDRPVSGVIPPYWSHHRNASRTSQISLDQPAITLEDHTEDPNSETSRGLWAKSVTVDDYAVVQGKTGVGAYVVWNCRIQTLDGGPITVRMRYVAIMSSYRAQTAGRQSSCSQRTDTPNLMTYDGNYKPRSHMRRTLYQHCLLKVCSVCVSEWTKLILS